MQYAHIVPALLFLAAGFPPAAGANGGSQKAPRTLIFPWVSNNDQFRSTIIVNNPGENDATITLTAARESGDPETTEAITVPARGFHKSDAGELFPGLGAGSGYSVALTTESADIRGRWVTVNLLSATGTSPSQGVAIDIGQSAAKGRFGNTILFGFLPLTDGFFSAPVVVNLSDTPADVTLSFYNQAGQLVAEDRQTLLDLEPLRPFARVANDLLPDIAEDVYLVATSSAGPITGAAFVFNLQGETAIGNTDAFDPQAEQGPTQLLYPWISNNADFESILVANNLSDQSAQLTLIALRADGTSEAVARTVAARGFLRESAASLFPTMGEGNGYSVQLTCETSRIRGRWVTYNLKAASGRSPSQGVALDIPSGNTFDTIRSGSSINIGFLPVTNGFTSGPVICNLADTPVDVTLYLFNQAGTLVKRDTEVLAQLPPFRPFAAIANHLAPEAEEDLYAVAYTPAGTITGVAFVFNDGSEPAIGNGTAIPFIPPAEIAAEPVTSVSAADVANRGDGSDLEITFTGVADSATLSAYRIIAVKAAAAGNFDLETAAALPIDRYTEIAPGTASQIVRLEATSLDSDGETLTENVAYQVFVMSVADGSHAQIDALSLPSETITLAFVPTVHVTYICNDGVLLSDGTHEVVIDGIHLLSNNSGWVSAPAADLQALQNAVPPWDAIDLVMVTHNHGDHYSVQAITTHMANNANARFIGPPQVTANLGNASWIEAVAPPLHERAETTVNGIRVEVLHMRHFDMFGNDFSSVQNYAYLVHMGGLKMLHLGDLEVTDENLAPFNLAEDEIDVVFIPTFADLIDEGVRDIILNRVNPRNIVALHLQSNRIRQDEPRIRALYPEATIFTEAFQTVAY